MAIKDGNVTRAMRRRVGSLPNADRYEFHDDEEFVGEGEHRLIRATPRNSDINTIFVCADCGGAFLSRRAAEELDNGRCAV